jgi:hypothetical protein
MSFRVVCISFTDGARAETVGGVVAERLGYRYVDDEIIVEASRMARVDPSLVAATEKKRSLLERLLDSLSAAQLSLGPAALAAGFAIPVPGDGSFHHTDKDDLRSMIRAVIHEVCEDGSAVIGAHAASYALAGKPGVLRVLVTAPDEVRAARVAEDRGLSAADARDAIESGDSGRRQYLRTFYEAEDEAPTRYDLVVNSEVLTPEEIASLIVSIAR